MEWINVILQGVLVGGLYAMFAAGLSLIFGVMRLVNIAHGDLIVAYVALVVVQTLGIGPLTALIIVVPVMAAIGYVRCIVVRCSTARSARRSPAAAFGHPFGLSVIIQNGLLTVFTADSVKLQAGPIEVRHHIRCSRRGPLCWRVPAAPAIRGRGRRHRWPCSLFFIADNRRSGAASSRHRR